MMQTLRKQLAFSTGSGPLSSKGGSIAAAAAAAALAAIVIVVFLRQYRQNVRTGGVPTPVLVADKLIEKGASAESIGAQGLFKPTDLPRDQVKAGALTDAGALRGKVAVADILPGEQITAADFRAAGSGIITKLAANDRAMTVPLDSAHSLGGSISAGDRVDVIAGFMVDSGLGRQRPVVRTLMQNVLVLDAPKQSSGGGLGTGANQTNEITLRVADTDAPKLAFASDNGKLWLVLRPQNGRPVSRTSLVTLQTLLFNTKPVSAAPARTGSR